MAQIQHRDKYIVKLDIISLILKIIRLDTNMNLLAKTFVIFTFSVLLILPVAVKGLSPKDEPTESDGGIGKSTACGCVVFRLDDVKDEYLDPVTIRIMNLFLSKGEHLTLGLVMQSIGNDTRILNTISEGYKKGLFELALHGWEHKNYAQYNQQEQKHLLNKANERLRIIFGNRSDIFIPPYNNFNNETLMAMKELGIKILSSSIDEQDKFDQGHSIFNSSEKKQNTSKSHGIYFLPYTTDFKKFVGRSQVKVPVEEILKDIDSKLDKFGYAVVIIHPQSFIKLDKSDSFTEKVMENTDNAELDKNDINDLVGLVKALQKKGITLSSFHEVLNTTSE